MDAITVIKHDHNEVEQRFLQFEAGTGDPDEVVGDIVRLLSVHAAMEEQMLYPVVRAKVEGGGEIADHAIEEHQQVKRELADIEKLEVGSGELNTRMTALISTVRHHVEEEEGELLPKLQSSVDQHRLDQMGDLMERAKGLLPTHPHPLVPGTATAQLLAGPWASIADHVRDFVGGLRD
jgi:hemerythrin superfamily protein